MIMMIASWIAPVEQSKKLVPLSLLQISWNFDLSEGSELDDNEDVCEDNFANFFISDDKTSEPIQGKLAEVSTPLFAWQQTKPCYRKLVKSLKDQ